MEAEDYVMAALALCLAAGGLFALNEMGMIKDCTDPPSLRLASYIESGAEWGFDRVATMQSHIGQGHYISIWYGNEDYGLGIQRDGMALPDDGDLPNECRRMIWDKIKPLVEAHNRAQRSVI
jgi:hypothetical protein